MADEWIRVEDRLPEPTPEDEHATRWVLVYRKEDWPDNPLAYLAYRDPPTWRDEDSNFFEDITHWRELPPPPPEEPQHRTFTLSQEEIETAPEVTIAGPPRKPAFNIKEGHLWIVHVLHNSGLAKSHGDANRVIAQGGVFLNGTQVTNCDQEFPVAQLQGAILQVGSKRRVRLKIGGQS